MLSTFDMLLQKRSRRHCFPQASGQGNICKYTGCPNICKYTECPKKVASTMLLEPRHTRSITSSLHPLFAIGNLSLTWITCVFGRCLLRLRLRSSAPQVRSMENNLAPLHSISIFFGIPCTMYMYRLLFKTKHGFRLMNEPHKYKCSVCFTEDFYPVSISIDVFQNSPMW